MVTHRLKSDQHPDYVTGAQQNDRRQRSRTFIPGRTRKWLQNHMTFLPGNTRRETKRATSDVAGFLVQHQRLRDRIHYRKDQI
jgi:hypothetical protein